MKYEKPEVTVRTSALYAIQVSGTKPDPALEDSGGNKVHSISCYEEAE